MLVVEKGAVVGFAVCSALEKKEKVITSFMETKYTPWRGAHLNQKEISPKLSASILGTHTHTHSQSSFHTIEKVTQLNFPLSPPSLYPLFSANKQENKLKLYLLFFLLESHSHSATVTRNEGDELEQRNVRHIGNFLHKLDICLHKSLCLLGGTN